MSKDYIGIFDVIGPVMVGPSSSHTSGAVMIAWMSRQIFSGTPKKVTFTLYGSFADTYKGHGTDRALIGGMLGYKPDMLEIRSAYEHAAKAGLDVSFVPDSKTEVDHPNTVDVLMEDVCGHTLLVRGESIGGGRVRITRMNDIEVDFTGENSTMIIGHQDVPGMIAFITHCLAEHSVNIASLKNFRKEAGKGAITVVEADGFIPEEVKDTIMDHKSVVSVDLIEL